ncbi:MAG TPA: Rv1535 family protein [Mycobacterium sp.]|nr:Rv1535 family protein [Mycobacterium sp.]
MTAVLYDDAVTTPPAPTLTPAPAQKQARKRLPHPPIGAGGDPMLDAATRLLSIPLRQVYAVLWRVGLIEVTA